MSETKSRHKTRTAKSLPEKSDLKITSKNRRGASTHNKEKQSSKQTKLMSNQAFIKKFITDWEIPRKLLHSGIGLLVLMLYRYNYEASDVTPKLALLFVPAFGIDVLRFQLPWLNKIYCWVLFPLMRSSETKDWNGVIFYLVGTWTVLSIFPLDIAVIGIFLLAFCDTAASTFGKSYGYLLPNIRKGKSWVGTLSAFIVGIACTYYFYKWEARPDDTRLYYREDSSRLSLPLYSIIAGFLGALSEVISFANLDDNVLIPVISSTFIFFTAWLAKK